MEVFRQYSWSRDPAPSWYHGGRGIALVEWADDDIPTAQKDIIVRAIDSFLIRRGICRLTTADYNRMFVQLMDVARDADPDTAGHEVVNFMAEQTAESRRWPADDEFTAALTDTNLHKSVYRARLKTLLVGLENHCQYRIELNIEHLMPQEWRMHWSLPESHYENDRARRTSVIRRLGNLTLTTTRLNPSLSNKPWEFKRTEIQKHSLLKLSTESVLSRPVDAQEFDEVSWPENWDEARITARERHLAALALTVWPHRATALSGDAQRSLVH